MLRYTKLSFSDVRNIVKKWPGDNEPMCRLVSRMEAGIYTVDTVDVGDSHD